MVIQHGGGDVSCKRSIALGCPGTEALGSRGIAPSRGAGFNLFSAGVMFLLSIATTQMDGTERRV